MMKIYTKLVLGFIILLILTLTSCESKNSPEYVAKQYLIALKNKDYKAAKKYATHAGDLSIDMFKALGTNFGLTDVKDIKCELRGDKDAICTFCCTTDSLWKEIRVAKSKKDGWLVYPAKEPPSFEE